APGKEHPDRNFHSFRGTPSRYLVGSRKKSFRFQAAALRTRAEVIASNAAWLMVLNGAIDHIIQNNPKARQNPRGLRQLDSYKRGPGELADWESPKVRPGPGAQGGNPGRGAPGR